MSVSRRALYRWAQESDGRQLVMEVLDEADIGIDYIHSSDDDRSWGLLLKLPSDLAEVIGTKREVLLWGTMHAVAQARDLEQARQYQQANSVRIAQDVLFFVTADFDGAAVLKEAAGHLSIAVVPLTLQNMRNFRPRGQGRFSDFARGQLYVRDLYDLRPPVTRSSDFFGRSDLLNQLERQIGLGQSHVGLFGLRKIGKTSFINRLRGALRNRQAGLIAQVDLQRSNAINPTAEYLLWHLGEALCDGNRRVRGVPGRRLLGVYDTFGDIPDNRQIFELFDHDVRLISERTGMPIILMLDEIERIFPTSESSPWRHDYIRFWQLLRGLDQESPGRLRLVISGTNPQCVERHAVFGDDNPIYSYFSVTYLGPLAQAEVAELLKSYGIKMGLRWAQNVIERTHEDTGGHPALLRSYASMMHRRSHPRQREFAPRVEDARDVASTFLTEQGPLLAQVVAILEDQYKDEFEILRTLALGRVHEFREMARAFPEDTAHLIGYGLCAQPHEATRLSSQLLQTYLQRRDALPSQTISGDSTTLIGATVDGRYQVDSLVSAKGGYADVYRASSVDETSGASTSGDVALKVLRFGQLSVLEREVEVLQRFDHPNIVKFIGSGRLEDGRVYLAMQYLDGDTLRAYCEAATRPSEHRLMAWAFALLDALVLMHPKDREIRRLRATMRSEEDIQPLLEARYGYIHRDIKPENVVITNGAPVLIDFNISVTVSSPVMTVSSTPGYLPPELLGPAWSPRVDLYQLGVSLLQAAAGDMLQGGNREDLVEVMRSSVSPKTAVFLERLMDVTDSGYHAAFTARRDAQRLLDQLGG